MLNLSFLLCFKSVGVEFGNQHVKSAVRNSCGGIGSAAWLIAFQSAAISLLAVLSAHRNRAVQDESL